MNKLIVVSIFCLVHSVLMSQSRQDSIAILQPTLNYMEEVTLGGCKQWILVRGESTDNPILLYLHGGPGFPGTPYTHFDSYLLEKHFIVVNWDQRGTGKSYNSSIKPETMNVEQFLSDTHELIQLLKTRFSKKKIFLIGHSWGSILGLYTAYRFPEDLYAYIGVGQVVNMAKGELLSYNYTMEKAKEANDTFAINVLGRNGLPETWEGAEGYQKLREQRQLLAKYGGSFKKLSYPEMFNIMASSPYYSKEDQKKIISGLTFTQSLMWMQLKDIDFSKEVPGLKIPVYFVEGRCDYQVPFELLVNYFKQLKAPYKKIIWFENSGHVPNLEEPDAYQDKLINVVLKNCSEKLK